MATGPNILASIVYRMLYFSLANIANSGLERFIHPFHKYIFVAALKFSSYNSVVIW